MSNFAFLAAEFLAVHGAVFAKARYINTLVNIAQLPIRNHVERSPLVIANSRP
jgi:hypothetical protein